MTAKLKHRRYDGYIASDEPAELKQVLFVGKRKMIIREEFLRRDWDAERALPSRIPGIPRFRGRFDAGINGPVADPQYDNSPAPGAHHCYFYGVDWLI